VEGIAVRCFLAALAATCLASAAALAESQWERNGEGECVRVWTRSELTRGPVGIANGLILPARAVVGGFQGGAWGIALAPAALLAGMAEGLGLIFAGVTDLLTGGVLAVVPDGMARLRSDPILLFPEGRRSFVDYQNGPSCPDDPLQRERRYPSGVWDLPGTDVPPDGEVVDG
jgi:hypothetical protein